MHPPSCAARFSPTPIQRCRRARLHFRRERVRSAVQPARRAAARDRPVPDRLHRPGRLARLAGHVGEAARPAGRDRQRGLDGRQHRAAVLGRGVAEPRRRAHGRRASHRHRRVRRAAICGLEEERARRRGVIASCRFRGADRGNARLRHIGSDPDACMTSRSRGGFRPSFASLLAPFECRRAQGRPHRR